MRTMLVAISATGLTRWKSNGVSRRFSFAHSPGALTVVRVSGRTNAQSDGLFGPSVPLFSLSGTDQPCILLPPWCALARLLPLSLAHVRLAVPRGQATPRARTLIARQGNTIDPGERGRHCGGGPRSYCLHFRCGDRGDRWRGYYGYWWGGCGSLHGLSAEGSYAGRRQRARLDRRL
jgi:hypothetical protein